MRWVVCRSARGSVAFVSINALSVQVDTTISPTQVAILIFPFLIGFSASLFVAIITRMVSGTASGQPGGAPGAEAVTSEAVASMPRSILGAHAGGQSILCAASAITRHSSHGKSWAFLEIRLARRTPYAQFRIFRWARMWFGHSHSVYADCRDVRFDPWRG